VKQDLVAQRYRVFEQLGRGGMGSVYRVLDERTGRECALKRLSLTAQADRTVAALFETEFHTLSELAHPSIIEVYDYGIDGEGAYYTMELLAGQDLRSLGKLDWRKACELLRDVASSLAIVHSRRLVHCDVSSRNVQCTSDGRAKLLDFGAMVRMGVAKRVVGTPSFIAPEMLNLQTLDARTDLFSFGALAYQALTGRSAYPAENVGQLRDLWRRPIPAPSGLVPDVPAALSDLVLELIQISPNARPRSAGIVMERLCAIAGLPFEEPDEVASAYLVTPSLAGRDQQLSQAREVLLSSLQGRGGVILASGPIGGGRSRFLDACVLEAKLLGLQVVRIDPTDTGSATCGAASELCRQLFDIAPQAAEDAARLHASVLAHVVGARLAGAEPQPARPDRTQLLTALRDFCLSAVRGVRLFVAVDDADAIDDVMLSLLVALGQKAERRPLCLALTVREPTQGSAALDILGQLARRIDLPPLRESETEQLLGSVFGEVEHLFSIAQRVHAIARGNPRATLQLVSHLVTQGVARYEAGSFVLPERLSHHDLPSSLAEALEARVLELEPDAVQLARILALTDPSELSRSAYVELTDHGDRARTSRAIDRLVRAQVLDVQGERYRLSDPTWSPVLAKQLSHAEREAAHALLARVFEKISGNLTRRSYHLMESGQADAAIRLMLAQFIKDPNEPKDPLADYVPGLIDQIERAVIAAESLNLPAPLRMELRMKLCGASQFLGDIPRFLRIAPATLEQLIRDSGLAEYNALDPKLDPMTRLTEAFTRTQARYENTAGEQRSLPPIDAIRELARCCAMFAGLGATAADISILDRIPSLAPFVPLSPAVGAIHQFVEFTRALAEGRDDEVRDALPGFIARLGQPDGAGLGELYNKSLRHGALYMLGLLEASMGVPTGSDRVALIESEPGQRVNAQRVHLVCALMQGNAQAALAAQRNAELVMLQDGQQQRYPGTSMRSELLAFWLSEDVGALKQLTERVSRLAPLNSGWEALWQLTRCVYRLLQGDASGALVAIEAALELAKPLRSRDWAMIASAHLHALVAAGRAEEALEVGRGYMQICQEHNIGGYRRVAQAYAEALLVSNRASEAAALAESLIEAVCARGVRGLALGAVYELRARAALALRDENAFYAYCQRCATEYRTDLNPAVAARYQRLIRNARSFRNDTQASFAPRCSANDVTARIRSRLVECEDAISRARCVLAILAENTLASEAYFYALRGAKPELVCALPEQPAPHGLQQSVEQWLQLELAPHESSGSQAERSVDAAALHGVVLCSAITGMTTIAGIAALRYRDAKPKPPDAALVEALANVLLENDDVDPATCII
jgi:hypothetical protein